MSYLSFGLVAFCAGTSVSFFTLPVWITFANSIAKEGSRADWLGFFGNTVGAAMTMAAAAIAWLAVNRQIKSNEEIATSERNELLSLVRDDLRLVCHAIKLVWKGANLALHDEQDQKIRSWRLTTVLAFLNYMPDQRHVERIREDAGRLGPLNERRVDHVVFCLKEIARVTDAYCKAPPPGQDSERFQLRMLRSMRDWFSLFAREISNFDSELGSIFDEMPRADLSSQTPVSFYEREWEDALRDEDWLKRSRHRDD